MMKSTLALLMLVGASALSAQDPKPAATAAATPATAASTATPRVTLKTNMGNIVIELNPAKAPKSVENFLQYVADKHYDGTVFHRVIPTFMIQGGGFTQDLTMKPTRPPVANEADNGLSNLRGTVAMARTNDPNSATAQFFINVVDNRNLDHFSKDNGQTWGYAVFGKVVSGMDVVDAIKAVERGAKGPLPQDVPVSPVIILSAELAQ
jgi:peptidyl-prolyl cis-trans isomerase A (cyclophilin A)